MFWFIICGLYVFASLMLVWVLFVLIVLLVVLRCFTLVWLAVDDLSDGCLRFGFGYCLMFCCVFHVDLLAVVLCCLGVILCGVFDFVGLHITRLCIVITLILRLLLVYWFVWFDCLLFVICLSLGFDSCALGWTVMFVVCFGVCLCWLVFDYVGCVFWLSFPEDLLWLLYMVALAVVCFFVLFVCFLVGLVCHLLIWFGGLDLFRTLKFAFGGWFVFWFWLGIRFMIVLCWGVTSRFDYV